MSKIKHFVRLLPSELAPRPRPDADLCIASPRTVHPAVPLDEHSGSLGSHPKHRSFCASSPATSPSPSSSGCAPVRSASRASSLSSLGVASPWASAFSGNASFPQPPCSPRSCTELGLGHLFSPASAAVQTPRVRFSEHPLGWLKLNELAESLSPSDGRLLARGALPHDERDEEASDKEQSETERRSRVLELENQGIKHELLRLTQPLREGILSPMNLYDTYRIKQVGIGGRGGHSHKRKRVPAHFPLSLASETRSSGQVIGQEAAGACDALPTGPPAANPTAFDTPNDLGLPSCRPRVEVPLIRPRPIHPWKRANDHALL